MCVHHGWTIVRGLPPRGETRCWFCGHRLPAKGVPPRQTREYPPWTWPVEILSRIRARHGVPEFLTSNEWGEMMYGVTPTL